MAKQKEVRSKGQDFNSVKKIIERIMEEDKWLLKELAKH